MRKNNSLAWLSIGVVVLMMGLSLPSLADDNGANTDPVNGVNSVMAGPIRVLSPGGPVVLQRPTQSGASRLDAAKVRRSIKMGVGYLKGRQNANGSWPKKKYPGDVTALCTLALLNCDEPVGSPHIRKALDYLLTCPGDNTYFVSLRIMALATADPQGKRYRADVVKDVKWLVSAQVKRGKDTGGWGYGGGKKQMGSLADSSNSQFAVLALHEATQMGVNIPQSVWSNSKQYWYGTYDARDGDFRYYIGTGNQTPRGSMTCAGISSLIIIRENLSDVQDDINGQFANCCQPVAGLDKVETAFDWLANNYTVEYSPEGRNKGDSKSRMYYLYGLERAARLAGKRFIGPNDWYRDGAQQLLAWQFDAGNWQTPQPGRGEDNPLIATSFGLLFMSKGKRPVAIGKYNHGASDWNLHPEGIHYLTRHLEKAWNMKLNWQTVRARGATIDDLLETPVLFMSGRDAIGLDATQKSNLKKYIENGGFLFAEACKGDGCGNAEKYDQAFRALMVELFPDSRLELLDASHPIWTSGATPLLSTEYSKERPLYGLQACCRTSVVYCPANLSCYWSLGTPAILGDPQVNARLKKRIEYCTELGVSVVSYATGRDLKDKGETPTIVKRSMEMLPDRVLVFPKLIHSGGDNEAPSAWRNILRNVERLSLEIKVEKKMISPTLDELADHPFVFMHGRRSFSFTPDERAAIRTYLDAGGFIFADAVCASPEFGRSFRGEMEKILGAPLAPIAKDHEIWMNKTYGYQLDRVTLRIKDARAPKGFRESIQAPEMEGAEIDGRLAVVFSRYDLSCAMENTSVSECTGYTRESATQIGTNVILYNLLSDAQN